MAGRNALDRQALACLSSASLYAQRSRSQPASESIKSLIQQWILLTSLGHVLLNTKNEFPSIEVLMLEREKFDALKEKYGYLASWAVWAEVGQAPKSNVGDLSMFETDDFLQYLNPEIVLVGLNISRGTIKFPLANFHDVRPEAMDYKIRFALKESPLWGGYMTDIIKNFDEKESGKMMCYLRAHKEFEEYNVQIFHEELKDLGCKNPTIIAFGRDAHAILTRNLGGKYQILRVPHYAVYSSKEDYRRDVESAWRNRVDRPANGS